MPDLPEMMTVPIGMSPHVGRFAMLLNPVTSVRPFGDLSDAGVLWAINRYLFHPRGFALAIHLDDEGSAVGWVLLGDGREPWTFSETHDDECFAAFNAFLDEHTKETD